MDAFSLPSFHSWLALEQLFAVGALECKRPLNVGFRLKILRGSKRRDREDQFAVRAQTARSFQRGIADQNEFASRAWDLQLNIKRLNLDLRNAEDRLAFRTLALFATAAIGHSHSFGTMGTSEFDGHVLEENKGVTRTPVH